MKTLPFSMILMFFCFFACQNPVDEQVNIEAEVAAIEQNLIPGIIVEGDSMITYELEDRMDHYHVPGVSVAVVKNGKIHWAKAYGIANTNTQQPVDTATLFQAGSISKPLAALAALKLVQEGKMELDADINQYLKGWQVPDSRFLANEKVTLRLLLTHNAGMTVHGFPGYSYNDSFPSIIEVLNGQGNTGVIQVDTMPAAIWRYSGGGYTVMEKAVEDVSGMSLDEYEAANILPAMGMAHSTFSQPLAERFHSNASAAYRSDGSIIEGLWHNYPEQAAAGLWTTPSDLGRYIIKVQNILAGTETGPLSKETLEMMLTKHENDWGLGPALGGEGDSLLFRHGGKNEGFSNNMVAFAYQGAGVIVMTNADNGVDLMGEIIRGISDYYDWDISNARVVKIVEVEESVLRSYTGKYLYTESVDDIDDYFVNVSLKDGQLHIDDPNDGENCVLSPTAADDFLSLESGDRVGFTPSENAQPITMNWNGFVFNKVE
ncbi:MAG: serine hydrolase domain-containing protein [Bacteroidia bacterium]